jgi:hypothetical protein
MGERNKLPDFVCKFNASGGDRRIRYSGGNKHGREWRHINVDKRVSSNGRYGRGIATICGKTGGKFHGKFYRQGSDNNP